MIFGYQVDNFIRKFREISIDWNTFIIGTAMDWKTWKTMQAFMEASLQTTSTRKYRSQLPKITNSNFLVYYDFNGDAKRKEKDLKGKSILEIRQYIEYWENHKKEGKK